jgi:hypothetical protein
VIDRWDIPPGPDDRRNVVSFVEAFQRRHGFLPEPFIDLDHPEHFHLSHHDIVSLGHEDPTENMRRRLALRLVVGRLGETKTPPQIGTWLRRARIEFDDQTGLEKLLTIEGTLMLVAAVDTEVARERKRPS